MRVSVTSGCGSANASMQALVRSPCASSSSSGGRPWSCRSRRRDGPWGRGCRRRPTTRRARAARRPGRRRRARAGADDVRAPHRVAVVARLQRPAEVHDGVGADEGVRQPVDGEASSPTSIENHWSRRRTAAWPMRGARRATPTSVGDVGFGLEPASTGPCPGCPWLRRRPRAWAVSPSRLDARASGRLDLAARLAPGAPAPGASRRGTLGRACRPGGAFGSSHRPEERRRRRRRSGTGGRGDRAHRLPRRGRTPRRRRARRAPAPASSAPSRPGGRRSTTTKPEPAHGPLGADGGADVGVVRDGGRDDHGHARQRADDVAVVVPGEDDADVRSLDRRGQRLRGLQGQRLVQGGRARASGGWCSTSTVPRRPGVGEQVAQPGELLGPQQAVAGPGHRGVEGDDAPAVDDRTPSTGPRRQVVAGGGRRQGRAGRGRRRAPPRSPRAGRGCRARARRRRRPAGPRPRPVAQQGVGGGAPVVRQVARPHQQPDALDPGRPRRARGRGPRACRRSPGAGLRARAGGSR